MMTTFIFFLAAMAALHFVYEAIILPSIRLSIRFKLFALRDRLRDLFGADQKAREAFEVQQAAINNAVKMLSYVDSALVVRFERQLKADASMRNRVEKRIKIVEEFDSEEFQKIVAEARDAFSDAALANMGAWTFYVVPIAVMCLCFNKLKNMVKDIVSVPEGELSKVVGFDLAFS